MQASKNLHSATQNLILYREILAAAEELRGIAEKNEKSPARLWELLQLIQNDVERVLAASKKLI
jgi:hypothetical protein